MYIYIYGVAAKFGYGSARSDPDVWIGLDHLRFGMDRGYGSACGLRGVDQGFTFWLVAIYIYIHIYIYVCIYMLYIVSQVWVRCLPRPAGPSQVRPVVFTRSPTAFSSFTSRRFRQKMGGVSQGVIPVTGYITGYRTIVPVTIILYDITIVNGYITSYNWL